MLRFKPEVRIGYFSTRIGDVFTTASVWSLLHHIDVDVNSVNDGASAHVAGSLHGYDLAVDLDTAGDLVADLGRFAEFLRVSLPPGYDVLLEGDHVHVEFDVHRPALRSGVV